MLKELRSLRDAGYPQEFLNDYAKYRHEYACLPFSERCLYDFGYYFRMRYVEYMKERKHDD